MRTEITEFCKGIFEETRLSYYYFTLINKFPTLVSHNGRGHEYQKATYIDKEWKVSEFIKSTNDFDI